MSSGRVRLHVNIDHVATLRNARGTFYPDPVVAAKVCLAAGAHGITAHLREDRRHIRDDDLMRLRRELPAGTLLNMECAATDEMLRIARELHPDVVTLVPERREERTTEGGLDVVGGGSQLGTIVAALREAKIKVSLFIAADEAQIRASKALGAEQIELHTGEYAHQTSSPGEQAELARLRRGAELGHSLGLEIAAGHGLTLGNVPALVAIPAIVELNIGHAMIADAIFMSLDGAVKAMLSATTRSG